MKTILTVPAALGLGLGLVVAGCADPTPSTSSAAAATSASTTSATMAPVFVSAPGVTSSPTDPTAVTSVSVPAAPESVAAVVPSSSETVTASAPTAPAANQTPTVVPAAPPATVAATDLPPVATPATIEERITEWNLTSEQIAVELTQSDRIERSKNFGAGAPTGPMEAGMITDIVAGKFLADTEISSQKFGVMVLGDVATLTGSARSTDQIGRAMALALDTDGISRVVSKIRLAPTTSP